MSCAGNCNACPSQCGASKLITKAKEKLEGKEKMSSAVGGCHAGSDEKIGRLDERSQFIVERNNSCKWIGVIAMIVAVGGLFVAWTALRDLDAVKDQVKELKCSHDAMKEYAEDGRRAYEAAKKFRQRNR